MSTLLNVVSSHDIPDSWKRVGRIWEHSLHKMCSRTGAFPGAIPRYFIFRYSDFGDTVYDPFSGKGTTPLEACLHGRVGVGNDLCPDAYAITRAKVRPVNFRKIQAYLSKLKVQIKNLSPHLDDAPESVTIFYHKNTLRQILALQEILTKDTSEEADFITGLMCGILHGSSQYSLSLPCSHFFSMSPTYVANYVQKHPLKTPKRNVVRCLKERASTILVDPLPTTRGSAYRQDAAKLQLENESVNLIVTSPPYLDKQSYAKDNWLRLWFLGYDHKEVRDTLFHTGNIHEYARRMESYLSEMYRLLKGDSACFLIVGDINLRGGTYETANALIQPAEQAGFNVERIIIDPISRPSLNRLYQNNVNREKQPRGRKADRILELHKGNVKPRKGSVIWTSSQPLENFV